jgi:hypothetical protein
VNVVETIQAVRSAGGSVTVSAGALIVDAPPDLPGLVWDALATHKATLLDLLAPRTTYADLAAQEEREAIQAEAQAPPEAVAFDLPRPARRCRLIRDTQCHDPHRGVVTLPAGLEGFVAGDEEIGEAFHRIAVRWHLEVARDAGRSPVVVLIDGRGRVVDETDIQFLNEGDQS